MKDNDLTELDIHPNESICPRCRLVYLTEMTGDLDLCSDCLAEAVIG